ncbi:MAG: hypothetical protein HKO66_08615 [Saprospiraceae bacterium]|nr:hypothetical protein [Saprospiraceae bacterium]
MSFEKMAFNISRPSDWIFFYSKNAINFYFESEVYDANFQYGVIGAGSSKAFHSLTGHEPNFIGKGNAEEVALFINEKLNTASFIFIKAKNSLSSIEKLLDESIEQTAVEIYDNKIINNIEVPKCNLLVFTSPLNVQAWFSNYKIADEVIFAIGKTTAEAIQKYTTSKIIYCQHPSMENLYENVVNYILENRKQEQ